MSDTKTTFQTFLKIQRAVLLAVEPFEAALSPKALKCVALGAVAQWAADQDESISPERIVEFVREGVRWVHARYPAA